MNLTSAFRFVWAHCTPSQADWLKLLSSTLPTSLTSPTRNVLAPAAAGFGAAGAVVAAAAGGGGLVGAACWAGWHAASARAPADSTAAAKRDVNINTEPPRWGAPAE